jgi:thiol-disulfide isomerase/thioredoxin
MVVHHTKSHSSVAKVHRSKTHRSKTHRGKSHHGKSQQSKPLVAGLVFANWCGHCQQLEPHWKQLKVELKPHINNGKVQIIDIDNDAPNKDSLIASINATINGQQLKADGFPTIFKTSNGQLEYYKGERDTPSIKQWIMGGSSVVTGGSSVVTGGSSVVTGGYTYKSKSSKSRKSSKRRTVDNSYRFW